MGIAIYTGKQSALQMQSYGEPLEGNVPLEHTWLRNSNRGLAGHLCRGRSSEEDHLAAHADEWGGQEARYRAGTTAAQSTTTHRLMIIAPCRWYFAVVSRPRFHI